MNGRASGNKFLLRGITATLLISVFGGASAGELEDAKKLMFEGRPDAAYELLSSAESAHQDDADYLYTMGVAAIDSRNYEAAIPLLERVIKLSPDNMGAHIDLGRAYFHTGKREEARKELNFALDQDPPAGAKLAINQYIAALNEQEQALSGQTHAFVDAGLGYDDNLNNATAQSQISVPLFGNALLTLTPTSLKTKSSYATLVGGVNTIKPISDSTALYASASLAAKKNFGHSNYDNFAPDVKAGVIFGQGNYFVRAGLFASQYYLQSKKSRDNLGVNGDWYYVLNEQDKVGVFGQYSSFRFSDTTPVIIPAMPNENFKQSVLGTSWTHQYNPGSRVALALIAGHENAPRRIDGNKDTLALRLSADHSLNDKVGLSGSIGYQPGRYKLPNPLFMTYRKDTQYDVNAGINYQYDKDWSVRGQYTFVKNRSNIVLNDFTRNDLSITVHRDF